MPNLRSTLNPKEQRSAATGPTVYRTEANHVEISCGMCGNLFFVDKSTADSVREAIKQGLDNPFRCEDCKEEYDELAYEG
ncbi:MAG TPA: hypothetical protein VJS44_12690 [Pyrinomonadaceae bacterium]|nr:hypothetical protein [Pyrinomonadaceae bacterium]